MTTHFIRVHAPFSVPKQWVTGKRGAIGFTENQSECGQYTLSEAAEIIHDLQQDAAGSGLIIAMDAI